MAPFRSLPTPSAMVRYLDQFVHGQSRAKRELCTAAYRHYLNLAYREHSEKGIQPFGRRHVLLLGPTGTGKTYMVRMLAECLGVPVAFGDATSLVETGYVGEHLDGLMRKLYIAARGELEAAQRGIVFIDEIDKIRRQEVNSRDVAGEGVQTSLLAPLDGSSVDFNVGNRICSIDTGRLMFICTGAFVGLTDIIRRRLSAGRTLGFHSGCDVPRDLSDDDALAKGEFQDLREYGMIPEFLGRFSVISTVQSLSRDDLVALMKHAKDSPLWRAMNWYHAHNLKLVVPDESLALIADKAIATGSNARGLERILAKLLAPFDWRLSELADDCYQQIVLTPEAVLGQAEPQLELGAANSSDLSPAARLREHAADLLHPIEQPTRAHKQEAVPQPSISQAKGNRTLTSRKRRRNEPDNQLMLPFGDSGEDERRSTNGV